MYWIIHLLSLGEVQGWSTTAQTQPVSLRRTPSYALRDPDS